ncbi:MAG: cytochrome c-type biogenesis protein CcmH [Acidimicrobiia bacterium]
MSGSSINRSLKRWPAWVVMALAVVALMAIGISRASGPATAEERIDSIAQRLACPTCDGESVYESRGSASQAIRQEIARQVSAGLLSDDQIVVEIDDSYEADLRLVPDARGIEAAIWIAPVAVAVGATALLVWAFRRWRGEGSLVPTDAERALVEAELHKSEDR